MRARTPSTLLARTRTRSVSPLIASWFISSSALAEDPARDRVSVAEYPTVYSYSAHVAALPSARSPHITYHNDGRVLGGLELNRHAKLGVIAMWMHTRLRLSEAEGAHWYKGVTAGPIFGYTRDDWCVHAMVAFGWSGQEFNVAARRILPVLLGCWVPTDNLLLRLGATAAWGPDRLRPIPLIAWRYQNGAFDTRGMVPLHGRAAYWVTPRVALGVGGAGFLMPYQTNTTSHGSQIGVVYTVFGAQADYRTDFGVGARLTVGGAMTPLFLDEQGRDFATRDVSPATMLVFYVDEGIRYGLPPTR